MQTQAIRPQRESTRAETDHSCARPRRPLAGVAWHAFRLTRWAIPRLLLPALALYLLWQLLPYLLLLLALTSLASRVGGRRQRGRGTGLRVAELALALLAAWLGLRRHGRTFGPAWHPCEQCGAPIDKPSRARYCSEACRRYTRLRHHAEAPEWDEVPF